MRFIKTKKEVIFMSTIPVMSYAYQAQTTPVAVPQQQRVNAPRALEAFEGETEALKKIYDGYMKNVGGYQNINGHMVHVTTVLHIDKKAQDFLMAVEGRLRDLGALPPLPEMPKLESSAKQIWTNPSTQYVS